MVCPKCSSTNVVITSEQVSGKTSVRGKGCLWSLGRGILICMTFGLWLLVGKRKGTEKTKFKNQTVAICQNCGYRWKV
jgi:hypothetical protein